MLLTLTSAHAIKGQQQGIEDMNIHQLEAAAIRTQQAAARAWDDLMQAAPSQKAEMQANYDAALKVQEAAYAAWEQAQ